MNKDIMIQAGFEEELKLVNEGKCPFCHKPVKKDEFKDAPSRKEHSISGMCQSCQDEFFE